MSEAPAAPRRPWRRLAAAVTAAVLALLVLRTFVARAYRVTTASMEPTILGAAVGPDGGVAFDGERVLVTFGVGELERFDLVVVDRGGDAPFVKRVAGLPGESVRVLDGDLLVDGRRLAADAPRPAPVELFDSTRDAVAEHFHFRQAPEGPWHVADDGTLELDGTAVPPGSDLGMLLLHKELRDGYRRHDGSLEPGVHAVGDGGLVVAFRLGDPATVLRVRLVEEGDLFELTIGPRAEPPDGDAAAEPDRPRELVLRRDPGGEVLARTPLALGSAGGGGWHRLVFDNVDNHLRALVVDAAGDERVQLTATYDGNRPYNGVLPEDRTSVAPRVAVGGEGGPLTLGRIRVTRDLHLLAVGTHAVDRVLDLGPDEVFLVGDNSADSADSRLWGPVPLRDLIGRPLAVIGPSDRWRVLR